MKAVHLALGVAVGFASLWGTRHSLAACHGWPMPIGTSSQITDLAAPSFKVAVRLTPAAALKIAGELLTVAGVMVGK